MEILVTFISELSCFDKSDRNSTENRRKKSEAMKEESRSRTRVKNKMAYDRRTVYVQNPGFIY